MNTKALQAGCQIQDKHMIADGDQETLPPGKSLRLFIRKLLGPRNVRMIKRYANDWLNRYARWRGQPTRPPKPVDPSLHIALKAGDQVIVRSSEEINATLNQWGQLKGCSFAPEMLNYCGSVQTVLHPVERFIDERDFRARKTKGIVLLEGSICHGTKSLGPCDRSCYYFWRVEWLIKNE